MIRRARGALKAVDESVTFRRVIARLGLDFFVLLLAPPSRKRFRVCQVSVCISGGAEGSTFIDHVY